MVADRRCTMQKRSYLTAEGRPNPFHPIRPHILGRRKLFYVPGSESGDILFLPCLFCWCWTTLTLVITFELFEIEPLYLACRFLVTRAFNSYKNDLTSYLDLDLWPTLKMFWTTLTLVIPFEPFEIEPLYGACRFLVTNATHSYKNWLWPWP